jgi:hypothetical protein
MRDDLSILKNSILILTDSPLNEPDKFREEVAITDNFIHASHGCLDQLSACQFYRTKAM